MTTLTYFFLLTFAAGGVVGAGCYLRALNARRARVVAAERLRIARELHDAMAHHVSGIIAQAHAAGVIHQSQPAQVGPILNNIAEAGQRTLDAMRRIVQVLRSDDGDEERGTQSGTGTSAEVYAKLSQLVSAFSDQGDGSAARLEIIAVARHTRVSPEVATVLHHVVREGLTNVRRHAPGMQATVCCQHTRSGMLRVDVRNTVPRRRHARPVGGDSGYGLLGLRERVEEVGGTLTAGPTDDGWWLIVHFPTFDAPPDGHRAAGHRQRPHRAAPE